MSGPNRATVMAVLDRDGYRCVRCGAPIEGERGRDWSLQHRRPRGMGGTRRTDANSPANLIALCGSAVTGCHGHVESHRAEAVTNGWLVPQCFTPATSPVLVDHGSRWVYLTDDGQYEDHPECVAGTSRTTPSPRTPAASVATAW